MFQNQATDRQEENETDEVVNNFQKRCVVINSAGRASDIC